MQGFVLVDLLLLVLSPLSDRGRAALLIIVANCCNVYGGDSVYTVQEMLLTVWAVMWEGGRFINCAQ